MCPRGFVSGICLPPAGEVFKCVGNCLLLLMAFQTLLNCSGSKCEEKWGLSNCLLKMERNRITIFAWSNVLFAANTEVMAPVQTRYIHEEPGKLFDKTVLLLRNVISEIFWVQLFDRGSQEALCRLLTCGCKPRSLYFPHL